MEGDIKIIEARQESDDGLMWFLARERGDKLGGVSGGEKTGDVGGDFEGAEKFFCGTTGDRAAAVPLAILIESGECAVAGEEPLGNFSRARCGQVRLSLLKGVEVLLVI